MTLLSNKIEKIMLQNKKDELNGIAKSITNR